MRHKWRIRGFDSLPLQGYRDRLREYEEYVRRVTEGDSTPLTVSLLLGMVNDMIDRQKQLLVLIDMAERERDEVIAEIRPTKPWEKMAYATAYGYEISKWHRCVSKEDAQNRAIAEGGQLIEGDGHFVAVDNDRAYIFQWGAMPPRYM